MSDIDVMQRDGMASAGRIAPAAQPWSPRLAGVEAIPEFEAQARPMLAASRPVVEATDPRWVLARRTAEMLQGTLLAADHRERLIRIGRMMGLTAFDANVIIAIVQDQARRGIAVNDGQLDPTQLQYVTVTRPQAANRRRWIVTAALVTAFVAFEVWWLVG